ncbi:MAG: hypothetical protein COU47_03190 [Candidatus Niyogibacteria bacterium CG10_big_fil_rev_8_21_14_0_10_46_36]|uniref:Uncharacterized protein n=1 Tax=Candidatus Niyogibacteria bacterium CG10_big_fil_rev_8_21_14_0_10_46_36 TaxID=1974726 RepID=A0A2H0TCR2_9BACT|nr:MAG: hypothetical protein COU47_03190 [Candidatus Niyogibacteria bacterium CG10_big_fil_rev_8_21_14_0_10_46_36]
MSSKSASQKYRRWYAALLRLYPASYRVRFGEGMEQTFNDILRERAGEEKGLFVFMLWMCVETSVGIIKENITNVFMRTTTKRLSIWAVAVSFILSIPLVLTLLGSGTAGEGWHWTLPDFVLIGGALFSIALAYELIARRTKITVYRAAFSLGLAGAFLLFWVNGAVGIIGNEGQPANVLYGAVFVVGLVGSLASRFQPKGMARTLFVAAIVQMLVPVAALIIWPSSAISWSPSVLGVFILSAFFAAFFLVSAMLFQRADALASK